MSLSKLKFTFNISLDNLVDKLKVLLTIIVPNCINVHDGSSGL